MNLRCTALLGLAFTLAAPHAWAQSQRVFRCGADGRTYSQTPCNDGSAVEVADPRSAEQRRAAQRALQKEEDLTEQMAAERRAREAAAQRQGATHIPYSAAIQAAAPTPASAAASASRRNKTPPTAPGTGTPSTR